MAKQTPAETPAELAPVEVDTPALTENGFVIEDNTDAVEGPVPAAEEFEVDLGSGFTLVTYK